MSDNNIENNKSDDLQISSIKSKKLINKNKSKKSKQKLIKNTKFNERAKVSSSYFPSEEEDFMNQKQLAFFKNKLLDWREELLIESSQTLMKLQENTSSVPDLADRASTESDRSLELRTRDRERKLVSKINSALQRIYDGSYGFCKETDEPIGIKRLIARPIATLSIEAQERHEKRERVYRDE